jgi:hypothetical protein
MSSQFKITYKPTLAKLSKRFSNIEAGKVLKDSIKKLALSIEREAKMETPVDKGGLRSSIRIDKSGGGLIIRPHVPYARWIHEGKMTRRGKTVTLKGGGRAGTPRGGKKYMKIGAERAAKGFEKTLANKVDRHIRIKLKGL